MNKLLQITTRFAIDGTPVDVECLSGRHSCKTYICRTTCEKKHRRYILQEINNALFPQPDLLMDNIVRITGHLQKKLYEHGVWDPHRRSLVVVPTVEGQWYLQDQDSRNWRMYRHVEDSIAMEKPADCQQIYQVSMAYGEFLRQLADLPDTPHQLIPDFYDGIKQMKALKQVARADRLNRAGNVGWEMGRIDHYAGIFNRFQVLVKDKTLPMRTTHNDCCMNNVLLDTRTAERVCVIGLDRVMSGLAAYDFGNLVCSLAGGFPDNECAAHKVEIRMDRFEAIAKGYLEGAGMMLTAVEKESFIEGVQMISLLTAVRTLTRYLAGQYDCMIPAQNHDLLRCRVQLELLNLISGKEQSMMKVLKSLGSIANHK